jgi:hypothetical protein
MPNTAAGMYKVIGEWGNGAHCSSVFKFSEVSSEVQYTIPNRRPNEPDLVIVGFYFFRNPISNPKPSTKQFPTDYHKIAHSTQPTSYFFGRKILPCPHTLLVVIILVVTPLFSSTGVRNVGHLLQTGYLSKTTGNILWF